LIINQESFLLSLSRRFSENIVISDIGYCYTNIIKFGWYEDTVFHAVIDDFIPFNDSIDGKIIANRLLAQVVNEIHQPFPNQRTSTIHRKCAIQFRDACLFTIFKNALSDLDKFAKNQLSFANCISYSTNSSTSILAIRSISNEYHQKLPLV
jgi:hypothetical protein